MTDKAREIARNIVQQAMSHESAIETKISTATLLIGIEHELIGQDDLRRREIHEAREWLKACLGLVEGGNPPNWDGIREFLKRTNQND